LIVRVGARRFQRRDSAAGGARPARDTSRTVRLDSSAPAPLQWRLVQEPCPRAVPMPLQLVKDYLRRRRLARAGVRRQLDVPVFRAGARSGVWAVCPNGLTAGSVVYSFGVGDNVAWDLAMIDAFGLAVHAFDPTPGAVAWVADQTLPPAFHFHPIGLAAHD